MVLRQYNALRNKQTELNTYIFRGRVVKHEIKLCKVTSNFKQQLCIIQKNYLDKGIYIYRYYYNKKI